MGAVLVVELTEAPSACAVQRLRDCLESWAEQPGFRLLK